MQVDVSKNFDFVTNFGTFPISQLMTDYIFDGVFNCLAEFFEINLPMNPAQTNLMRRILKLSLMSA